MSFIFCLKTHALVGVIVDWVRDGMHDNYMKYFDELHDVLEMENYGMISNMKMTGKGLKQEKDERTEGKKGEEAC